ncbi:extracellular solute-binding protein [uncultured Sphaerochaeta sp.]|uniref:extracellular solute-binding protein n=1 Tax=uncultured Sphaerochaeta sp. TaxID=886478 RepID=UPI002A0A8A37|nr:extracellular solute-binding protein [uncultured Sphaerochaeta sp.]
MKKRMTLIMLLVVMGALSAFAQGTIEQSKNQTGLSGSVVVYCPSPNTLANKIASGFETKTGVKVEMFQGTTGKINARLEAEKANPVADVVILASWPDGMKLVDQALSYDAKDVAKMQKNWVDPEHKLYGYSASAIGVIYNTTIYPTLSADWKDFGKAQYKDAICMPDPLSSGSCKDFITGLVNVYGDEGWQTLSSWKANGLMIPGANSAALEAVMTGSKGILLAAVDYNGYAAIAKGEPLGLYYPEGGTVINPRPAFIMKTSKNLDNAKAFMDYLLSDEAQQMICDAYLLPGRTDIKATNRANVSDIKTVDYDWDWMLANSSSVLDQYSKIMEAK